MNIELALKNIDELLIADNSLPVDLNNKSIGLNEEKVTKLLSTLDFLIEYYSDKSTVPKALAFAFVDVSKFFERSLSLYSEDVQERIFDIKEEIVAKAYELFE